MGKKSELKHLSPQDLISGIIEGSSKIKALLAENKRRLKANKKPRKEDIFSEFNINELGTYIQTIHADGQKDTGAEAALVEKQKKRPPLPSDLNVASTSADDSDDLERAGGSSAAASTRRKKRKKKNAVNSNDADSSHSASSASGKKKKTLRRRKRVPAADRSDGDDATAALVAGGGGSSDESPVGLRARASSALASICPFSRNCGILSGVTMASIAVLGIAVKLMMNYMAAKSQENSVGGPGVG